ncbi:MAG: insulinase family protein [bacterium]|nr:insulinase family protein [bacterium]
MLVVFVVVWATLLLPVADKTKAHKAKDEPKKTENKYFQLDNGLKVYLERRDKIPLVNVGFAINVGSKDEDSETSGLVHLLEHLVLLGGTHSFTGEELIRDIRNNGLYFNAHTSHDLMTLDISAPSEHIDFALRLAREKIFNLKLNLEELEKEKKVVLEELSQIEDDPNRLGLFLSLQALFADHPYRYPVTGNKENVKNADVQILEMFYKDYFVPSNCAVAVVGDMDILSTEAKIKELFGAVKSKDSDRKQSKQVFKTASPLKKTVKIKREMDITQGHLFLCFSAPHSDHKDKVYMDVLSRILGHGVNPLLNSALRGRRKLVDGLSMSYIHLKYGGALLIHMIMEPKKISYAKNECFKFLKKCRNFRYAKEDFRGMQKEKAVDYLETAKNGIEFGTRRFKEQGLNLALAYARHILKRDNADSGISDYSQRLKKARSSDIRKIAGTYFAGKKYVLVSILPAGK